MRFLLDTHVFLWWISDDARLSVAARGIISDPENDLFLSAASGWEIAVKAGLGRLKLPDDLESFIAEQLAANAIHPLPVHMRHALHTRILPEYHRDPFDRLLIAQARLESIPILSADPLIARYPVEVVW